MTVGKERNKRVEITFNEERNSHYTGTQVVKINSGNWRFDLRFKRKYTIVRGDSGTGKTLLNELVRRYNSNVDNDTNGGIDDSVKIKSSLPVFVVTHHIENPLQRF